VEGTRAMSFGAHEAEKGQQGKTRMRRQRNLRWTRPVILCEYGPFGDPLCGIGHTPQKRYVVSRIFP
jgi:hypothetical protein